MKALSGDKRSLPRTQVPNHHAARLTSAASEASPQGDQSARQCGWWAAASNVAEASHQGPAGRTYRPTGRAVSSPNRIRASDATDSVVGSVASCDHSLWAAAVSPACS